MISTGPKFSKQNLPKGALVFSATRKEKFDRCNRLWWLTEGGPLSLKEPDKGYLTFGTVLHAVIERYLKSDRLGPLDDALYPVGWGLSCSNREQAQIKELFQKAVDEGVVARLPGQIVEHNFVREVEPATGGIGGVFINSTVDLITADGIQDHKTTKSMRYAKSAEALRTNAQMLTYAFEFLALKKERGEVWPEKIELRHNVFCKDEDNKVIRVTKAYVTPKEVLAFWHSVITDTIPAMKQVRELRNWHEVPGPEDPSEACNAYGGCFARNLCAKRESIDKMVSRHGPAPKTNPKEPKKMSLLDSLKKKLPGTPPATEPSPTIKPPMRINPPAPAARVTMPKPLPTKQQAVEAVEVREVSAKVQEIAQASNEDFALPEGYVPPPWAIGACTACRGLGFNTNGNPCRICDGTRLKTEGITSAMFAITTDEEGFVSWVPRDASLDRLAALGYEGEDASGEIDVTGEEEVEVEEREAPEPAPVAPPKRGPGRPSKAELELRGRAKQPFIMFMGCHRLRGDGNVLSLEDLVLDLSTEIVKGAKLKSIYDLDVWKRRDALASMAADAAQRCIGKSLVVSSVSNDNKGLVENLMALAQDVFIAEGFFQRNGGA